MNDAQFEDLAKALREQADNHLTNIGPEISEPDEQGNIEIMWVTNNDGHPCVTFTLLDTGDQEEKIYDLDITVSNCDNVGPITMLQHTTRCMKQFYEMGLNTRFGRIVGDPSKAPNT